MPDNSSAGVGQLSCGDATQIAVRDGRPVCVERGPAWLAELLFFPPPWLRTVQVLLFVGVLVLVTLAVYRHGGVPDDAWHEIGANGVFAGSVFLSAYLVPKLLPSLGYLSAVVVSVTVGISGFHTLRWLYDQSTSA